MRQAYSDHLKFPSEIPVSFALPFQFKLPLALVLQLALLLLLVVWLPAPKRLIEAVANILPRPLPLDDLLLRPQITPGNPRQPLPDLLLVQLLRLPPCGSAQAYR